jgi:hypothetical protein
MGVILREEQITQVPDDAERERSEYATSGQRMSFEMPALILTGTRA